MRTISEYDSYRVFLKHIFLQEKFSSNGVTLAKFAKTFGLSGSALNMIFSGQRSLTIASIHDIAHALKLSASDHEYFEAMVLKEQAANNESKIYYSRKLKKINSQARIKGIRVSDRRLLSTWLTPAILIYIIDILKINTREKLEQLDHILLAEKFSLRPDQISSLLFAFQESELLGIDSNDKVHITFEKMNHHLPQKAYVQSALAELAKRIESDFENKQTLFRGLVFSIEKDQVPALRKDVLAVFDKYMSKVSQHPENNIILQSLVGIFPAFNKGGTSSRS